MIQDIKTNFNQNLKFQDKCMIQKYIKKSQQPKIYDTDFEIFFFNFVDELGWRKLDIQRCQNIKFDRTPQYLTQLTIENCYISKLHGIQNMQSLQCLSLTHCYISDISNLISLQNLTSLELSNNKIVSICVLQKLTNLTILRLNSNQIIDISALKSIHFKRLSLQYNKILDFKSLNLHPDRNKEYYDYFGAYNCYALNNQTDPTEIEQQFSKKINLVSEGGIKLFEQKTLRRRFKTKVKRHKTEVNAILMQMTVKLVHITEQYIAAFNGF
ncbi:Conserved_hypothetical protein [Hexamita inflata]|uniref:Uncharacterized protein n=1 Tax=Hexamita inflata TaxID=28002 RepID=A0AA86R5H2_9EUKA|nr:Conserved hypothetical protein [Hexamita inflata]